MRVNVFHGNSHHVTYQVYFFLIRMLVWLAVTATIQRWVHTLCEIFFSRKKTGNVNKSTIHRLAQNKDNKVKELKCMQKITTH